MRHQSSPAKRKAAAKRKALIRQRALACSTTSTASRSPKRGSSAKQVVPATSNSFVQALRQHLPTRLINRLARQTGFQQRQAKKLSPTNFLLSATLLITQSTLSLRTWAVLIGWIIQGTFTKQSLHERLNGSAVRFLEAILQALLNSVGQLASAPVPPSLAFFARVILHDSTCAKLSEKLAAAFPGPSNPKGTRPGMLKVQAAYDLLAHTFVHFSLSSYCRNDQAASGDALEYLRPRDLLVRDLGYFATAVLQRIDQLGAFFLSRLHANATLYEKDGRSPFDLLDALRRQGRLDRRLRLGPAGLEVRVVAVPVPAAIAADRRGKARREAGRSQPSARRLALLNWEIFITNVPTSVWSPRQVVQIYGLRWRIEIVFKAWKSHLHLRVLPQTGSALEIQAMVCAKLIFITLFDVCFWRPLLLATCASKVPLASLLNLADLVAHALLTLVLEELEIRLRPLLHQQIQAHARHDKRRRQPLLALFQN